jgi:hypothetical protein
MRPSHHFDIDIDDDEKNRRKVLREKKGSQDEVNQ